MADEMTRARLETIVADCVGKRRGAGPAVDAIMLAADQYASEVAFDLAAAVVETISGVAVRALVDRAAGDGT